MTESLWETVAKLFNTTKKSLDQDVIFLQEWLETQPHLPKILDSNCLRNFLILNKCSIQVAKQKIDNYYTVKSRVDDVYAEINPKLPYLQRLNELVYFVTHPQLSSEMYTYIYFKVKNKSLMQEYEPMWAARKLLNMQELNLRNSIIFGDVYIFDCKHLPASAILKFTPTFIYNIFKLIYEKVYSIRIKAVYLFNVTPHVSKLLTILKTVLKPKIAERFHVLEDQSLLKDVIPADMLVKDFGGNGMSLDQLEEILDAKFRDNKDLFDLLDETKVDESLRPKELRNEELVYGNFKRLNID